MMGMKGVPTPAVPTPNHTHAEVSSFAASWRQATASGMRMEPVPTASHDLFLHTRILMGMIVGLGLTHLLRGVARIIEQPGFRRVYWVHLLWLLSMFLYLLHFWWWEFRLGEVTHWNFNRYFFLALYALLLYLLCALVLPERLENYRDYRDYFYARRHWFFAALALVYLVDFGDTWLKGEAYFRSFGTEYVVRNLCYIGASLVAIATRSPVYHGAFAVVGLAYQLSWILRQFETIA